MPPASSARVVGELDTLWHVPDLRADGDPCDLVLRADSGTGGGGLDDLVAVRIDAESTLGTCVQTLS